MTPDGVTLWPPEVGVMGAWGAGSFDNDDASDFVHELEETSDLDLVRAVLTEVVETSDYLEAPEGSVAGAAADVVASARGNPPAELVESVRAWLTRVRPEPSDDDIELALRALDRVRGTESELAELWSDAGEGDWSRAMADLESRLRG